MGQCCGNSRKSGLPSNDTAAGMKRVGTRWDKNSEKKPCGFTTCCIFSCQANGFQEFFLELLGDSCVGLCRWIAWLIPTRWNLS